MRPGVRRAGRSSPRLWPLGARRAQQPAFTGYSNVTVFVSGELDDHLKKPSLIGGIVLPGRVAGAGGVPVAEGMRDLQVRQDRWAAVIAWDWVMVSYWGKRMWPN